MISSMDSWLILSKAFSKFNLRITISFLHWWHRGSYSKVQAIQSCIVVVLMKPYWFLWNDLIKLYCKSYTTIEISIISGFKCINRKDYIYVGIELTFVYDINYIGMNYGYNISKTLACCYLLWASGINAYLEVCYVHLKKVVVVFLISF